MHRSITAIAIAFLALARADVLQVCPSGCPYALPSAAVAAANPLDVIAVQGGATYIDCINVRTNSLTIIGISAPTPPALTGKVCSQKGIVVNMAFNTTLVNLELYNASNAVNLAGVRQDATGQGLTMVNLHLHDNDDGVLLSSYNDIILMEGCLLENNGGDDPSGDAHNIYANKMTNFIFRNSTSRSTRLGGHLLKSRAYATTIDCSVLPTQGGQASRCVDACEAGVVTITGSVLQQDQTAHQSNMVAYGAEKYNASLPNSLQVAGNVFIEDRNTGTYISVFREPPSVVVLNNTFVGRPAVLWAGNTAFASRAAAGIAAFPYLPPPATCVTARPPVAEWADAFAAAFRFGGDQ